MPQASKELQDWAIQEFGSIADGGPSQYLEKQGWILRRDWTWIAPMEPNEYEIRCVQFLADEWDWGWYTVGN